MLKMQKSIHKGLPFWLLPVTALTGALFCAFSAVGITDTWCVTDGCDVYKDYAVAGISLYWFGAAAFALLFVLAFFERLRIWHIGLTWLFGLGSLGFLLLQFFMWPCTNCLIVAFFIGVCIALTAWQKQKTLWVLGGCWLILFGANLLALAKSSIDPYPAFGSEKAAVQIWFSPSCPACRQLVAAFLEHPALPVSLAFMPLAKDAADQRRIALLLRYLNAGVPAAEAFERHWREPADMPPDLRTRLILWRNQVAFSRLNIMQVPVVLNTSSLMLAPDIDAGADDGCSIFAGPDDPCDEPLPDPFDTLFN